VNDEWTISDDWADRAACKGYPIEFFFGGPGRNHDLEKGKKICARCPVARECREEAESFGGMYETWGLWGGEIYRDGVITVDRKGKGAAA
jgi:hypothetical protein